jgi:hypothetical protein
MEPLNCESNPLGATVVVVVGGGGGTAPTRKFATVVRVVSRERRSFAGPSGLVLGAVPGTPMGSPVYVLAGSEKYIKRVQLKPAAAHSSL